VATGGTSQEVSRDGRVVIVACADMPTCLRPDLMDCGSLRMGERKPTSGVVVVFGGVPINWSSKAQTSVACSSFEAELAAAFDATRESVAWKSLLEECRLYHSGPIELKEDNRSVVLSRSVSVKGWYASRRFQASRTWRMR
jgi:hypothetical protein